MIGSGKDKDTEFMNELEAATRLRPATSSTVLVVTIAALITFMIVWAGVSKVEEITRGQGQVVPSRDIQIVQSLEGGVLEKILVREGEFVKAGQIILRVSDVQFSSQERGTEAKFRSLQARKARLQSEANGTELVLPEDVMEKSKAVADNEIALYESRQKELKNAYDILDDKITKSQADISELRANINRLSSSRNSLSEELKITKEMVRKRAMPKLEEMRLSRELNDIRGQINANAERRKALEADMSSAKNERASQENVFRSKALKELGEVEAEIEGLQENLKSIGDRVDRTEIRAPVDGIVNNMSLKTVGGVVEPAMKLVEIVPVDDELKVTAKISPDDVAFLLMDMPVKVKISAYDSQRYGALNGTLQRIGANSITNQDGSIYFEIDVVTDKNHLGSVEKPLPVTPGMVADVEIITGKRTILAYLLKPILRAKNKAFTER
jgi:adhesin transport system membrane fusion protein